MEKLIGIIERDGYIKLSDNRRFKLPFRGTDDDGYPEVLIDTRSLGGRSEFYRQSIQPFIGMRCEFITNNGINGYNFKVI